MSRPSAPRLAYHKALIDQYKQSVTKVSILVKDELN